jgi:ribonuclease BN (tRNA processing enzyme)
MSKYLRNLLLAFLAVPLAGASASAQTCVGEPVSVQILGSAGPALDPERVSSSYLLWIGNQAKLLVDMGGGAHERFGRSKAKINDLSLVAISHVHPDHVADLPALLWLSNRFRKEPLPVVGPSGNNVAPSISNFARRLFDDRNGAFQVMGSALGSKKSYAEGSVRLDISVVDVTKKKPSTVFDREGMIVTAIGIPHGDMPTLAYRVQTQGKSIVFSSDQTGTDPRFVPFAKGADILIMHLTIGPGETNKYHAAPDVVGRIAQEANPKRLIVSHFGPMDLDAAIAELKKFYTGALTVGADLQCTPVQ